MASACGARGRGAEQRAAAPHEFGTRGAVVTDPNGKIVAPITPFGEFGIARYVPDGRLDRSFGINGKTATDLHANRYGAGASAVALQPDRKIVAFGSVSLGGLCGGDAAVVRYLPNGRLDPSFGSGGVVMTKMPEDSYGLIAGAVEPSGKIVAVGALALSGFCEGTYLELLGYTPDGRVDQTFGKGGKVVSSFTPAAGVVIQSDGKIVLAGSELVPSTDQGDVSALVRYLPNGHLDTQFGKHGIVLHLDLGGGTLSALAIQPDGKMVAAVSGDDQWGAARFDPNGHLDPSFGNGGKVGTPFEQLSYSPVYYSPAAVGVQGDGKILVGGGHSLSSEGKAPVVLAMVRYTSDGHVDKTFGDGGRIVDRSHGAVAGIAIEPGGRIIVLARRTPTWTDQGSLTLLAYTADGRPDLGFGK